MLFNTYMIFRSFLSEEMVTIICLAWIFTYGMTRLLMASILLVCAKNQEQIDPSLENL